MDRKGSDQSAANISLCWLHMPATTHDAADDKNIVSDSSENVYITCTYLLDGDQNLTQTVTKKTLKKNCQTLVFLVKIREIQ